MIIVHHLNNSRSQRVLWLLEELQLKYKIEYYERDAKSMLAPPELKKIHPLGKSPVITDGNKTIAESAAILDYLVDTYGQGQLKPAFKTEAYLKYNYWMHYAEGSLMSPLLMSLVFGKIKSQKVPFFIKPITKGIAEAVMISYVNPQIKLHLDYIEGELKKTKWFCGDQMTVADIQMSFPLEVVSARSGMADKYPNIMRVLKQIHENKNYQKALEKGGPLEILV